MGHSNLLANVIHGYIRAAVQAENLLQCSLPVPFDPLG